MTNEPDRPVPHRAPRNNLAGSFGRSPSQPGGGLSRLGPPRVAPATIVQLPPDPEPEILDLREPAATTWIPLEQVALNPLNDRDAEDYTNLDDLTSMQTLGQLQACGVVTVDAFLRLFPLDDPDDEYRAAAAKVRHHRYVVVMGSRRRVAAEVFKLGGIKADVDDRLARDRGDFLSSVASENLDRRNLTLLQEARVVDRLVRELGSGTKAGERLGKSRAWVSQRRAVLNLVPELKDLVRRREILIEDARHLGGLDPDRQLQTWKQIQEKRTRASRDLLTAVNTEDSDSPDRPAPTKPRQWRFTERQTPDEVSGLLLERFTGDDLDALIALLTAARK